MVVVEGDRPIAQGLQRALQRDGNIVGLSYDGQSALAALVEGGYDCIVLDLGLPDIDGTEVLRRPRKQRQHTPVVILSARACVCRFRVKKPS